MQNVKQFFLVFLAAFAPFYGVANGHFMENASHEEYPADGSAQIRHGIDAFVMADFIYWTTRLDNTAYASTGVSSGSASASQGTTCSPNWGWDPGFKVGLGLNLRHDGWSLFAEYTYLRSQNAEETDATSNGLVAQWNVANPIAIGSDGTAIRSAYGSCAIDFNALDINLGKSYFLSRFFKLRPHIGMKVAWIDVDYEASYQVETAALTERVKMTNGQDFWGMGAQVGLNTTWHLSRAWSIYGNIALSLLWSQFQVKRRDTFNVSEEQAQQPLYPLNSDISQFNTTNQFHGLKGVIECGIGLRGAWLLREGRFRILLQAGWEEQLWIHMNQLIKQPFVSAASGDLTLQGLTVKWRLDF